MQLIKLQAQAKGKALLAELRKAFKHIPWKLELHGNIGWHYSVSYNGLTVHKSHYRGAVYDAFLSEEPPGGIWVGRGNTAKAAVNDVFKKATASVEHYLDIINRSRVQSGKLVLAEE